MEEKELTLADLVNDVLESVSCSPGRRAGKWLAQVSGGEGQSSRRRMQSPWQQQGHDSSLLFHLLALGVPRPYLLFLWLSTPFFIPRCSLPLSFLPLPSSPCFFSPHPFLFSNSLKRQYTGEKKKEDSQTL